VGCNSGFPLIYFVNFISFAIHQLGIDISLDLCWLAIYIQGGVCRNCTVLDVVKKLFV
jgi:hypothetical protein